MMIEQYRIVARSLTHAGLLRPSLLKSFGAFFVCCAMTAAGWILAHTPSQFHSGYICGEVLLALSAYQFFVIMHECGHGSFLRSRWGNVIIGSIASIGCLIPYEAWARLHMLHHRWVGVVDRDPTQAHVLARRRMNTVITFLFRTVWKLRVPIPMIQFIAAVFWMEPFARVKKSGAFDYSRSLLSMAVCAVPHLALCYAVGPRHYAVSLGPALFAYFIIFEYVNLPQHSGMFPYTSETRREPVPLHEQESITRTSTVPEWISRYMLLNFNLHSEHHLFPSAPWHSLPALRTALRSFDSFQVQEVSLVNFNTDMRTQDPVALLLDRLPPPPVRKGEETKAGQKQGGGEL